LYKCTISQITYLIVLPLPDVS